jgi:hypothetical protein
MKIPHRDGGISLTLKTTNMKNLMQNFSIVSNDKG